MTRAVGSSRLRALSSLASFTPRVIGDRIRKFGIDNLEVNPLDPGSKVGIELLVPCGPGEEGLISRVLESAQANVLNPIERATVVSQTGSLDLNLSSSIPIEQLSDQSLLGRRVLDACVQDSARWGNRIKPGWFVQQLVKIQFARASYAKGVLVLDADTFLTGHRQFLESGGRQILIPSYELHRPYDEHYNKYFNQRGRFNLSFVAHHQLMQPDIINAMFSSTQSVLDWLRDGRTTSQSSPVSEYHSYGRFALQNFPRRVALASFRYRTIPRRLVDSEHLNSEWLVTSAHAYLRG